MAPTARHIGRHDVFGLSFPQEVSELEAGVTRMLTEPVSRACG
jgi:hypothetical protein